jgi:hypothetical protein
MGFFAVLSDPANPASDFAVLKCHLNFWSLSGILGRRNYLWDVGLHIKVGLQPFSSFQVAIPSGTTLAVCDLHDKLLDQKIDEMIFGKSTRVGANQIEYDGTSLQIPMLDSSASRVDTDRSTRNFTLWTLYTAKPVNPNTDIYLRVRFTVSSVGRCWQWKRFWLARYGALVDVRFADLREAWNVPKGAELKDRIVPIEQLNFFVVVPATYHLLVTSPPVHYIRILEGRSWEKYLDRKTKFWRSEKLCIYQWRNAIRITKDEPLRVFLQLHSQLGSFSKANLLLAGFVLICLSAMGVITAPLFLQMPATLQEIGMFLRAHLILVTLTTLGAFILALLNTSDELIRRVKWLGPAFDKCEQWLLGVGLNS